MQKLRRTTRHFFSTSFNRQRTTYQPKRRMRLENDGSTITLHPSLGRHGATVILLHGLGDSAEGWQSGAEQLADALPQVKFILPTANSMAVTVSGGMRMNAWYNIERFDNIRNLRDLADRCDGIDASVDRVRAIIENEVNLGLLPSRIVVSGFSQGGALALFTALQLPENRKPAGVVVMSSYVPGISRFQLTPGFEDVPIFHVHGTIDPVVQHSWGEMTKDALMEKGIQNYDFRSYAGLAHNTSLQVLRDVSNFLLQILPDTPEFTIAPKSPSKMSVKELKLAVREAGLSSQAVGFTEKSEFVSLLTNHFNSNNNNNS